MSIDKTEDINGRLEEFFKVGKRKTALETHQIFMLRDGSPEKNKLYRAANLNAYSNEEGLPIFYFGPREYNPILHNIKQIVGDKEFRIQNNPAEVEKIRNASLENRILRMDISKLDLEDEKHYSKLVIDLRDYDSLENPYTSQLLNWITGRKNSKETINHIRQNLRTDALVLYFQKPERIASLPKGELVIDTPWMQGSGLWYGMVMGMKDLQTDGGYFRAEKRQFPRRFSTMTPEIRKSIEVITSEAHSLPEEAVRSLYHVVSSNPAGVLDYLKSYNQLPKELLEKYLK